jgi:hypothetical protein
MMSRTGSFLLRLVGFLILIGLLAAGGVLIYQAGQAQGYLLGQAVGAAAEGSPSPAPLVPGYYPPAYFYPPRYGFFPFGGFLGLIFGVFLFFLALRLIFRPHYWGYPGRWHAHGHWPQGGHPWGPPPWARDNPSPEKGEAVSESSQASASAAQSQ